MKANEIVVKETLYIAVCSAVLSLLLQAVFVIAGSWTLSVLFGNLWGVFVTITNFFLMGISLQKAVEKDEEEAKKIMRTSQSLRILLMFILIVFGVVMPWFSKIAVIIPLFFTRVAVALRPLMEVREKNENK